MTSGVERWLGGLQALDPAEAARRLATALRWVGVLMAATVAGFGLYAWRIGARVLREGRFPPAGLAVVRETHIDGRSQQTVLPRRFHCW